MKKIYTITYILAAIVIPALLYTQPATTSVKTNDYGELEIKSTDDSTLPHMFIQPGETPIGFKTEVYFVVTEEILLE